MTAEKSTQETPQASEPVAAKAAKTLKPIAYEPEGEVRAVKAGTKLALLIDELAREEGTTLDLLAAELSRTGSPVDASGVRSWLSYDLRRAGYGVRQDGDRLYLVLPEGMTAPLAHREAGVKKAPETPTLKVEAAPRRKAAMTAKKSKKAARKVAAK